VDYWTRAPSSRRKWPLSTTLRYLDLGGKAKEAVGKVTGDKSTKNEGKGDQAKSNLKDAARR
jgi:hypothetical protein